MFGVPHIAKEAILSVPEYAEVHPANRNEHGQEVMALLQLNQRVEGQLFVLPFLLENLDQLVYKADLVEEHRKMLQHFPSSDRTSRSSMFRHLSFSGSSSRSRSGFSRWTSDSYWKSNNKVFFRVSS